uniref:Uncharacterized protein n=1 Tax=Alexandrium monilatum TaxID=311494 RepID=A0A7S4VXC3_9DINO
MPIQRRQWPHSQTPAQTQASGAAQDRHRADKSTSARRELPSHATVPSSSGSALAIGSAPPSSIAAPPSGATKKPWLVLRANPSSGFLVLSPVAKHVPSSPISVSTRGTAPSTRTASKAASTF